MKPENSLYDVNSRKATIIDVSGYLEVRDNDTLEKFKINKFDTYTISPYFCAPEMNSDKTPELNENSDKYDIDFEINIWNALSYTCGKIFEYIFRMKE